ncbi:MAG: hypothetical protein JSU04_20405 [Bdellovibrionales bacterium]|nr:hypothetical protein [Bdellovibrionales bacterium]
MQLAMSRVLGENPETRNKIKKVILTDRDFEILEFIMDMKFAGVEEVFEKYFKVTLSNEQARSSLWAKKRLMQLEKAKFLNSVRPFSEPARCFTATFKAYYALTQYSPEKFVNKPSGGFDQRTFVHDREVLKARLFLESNEKIKSWASERKLRSSSEFTGVLASQYIPDSIYITSSEVKVAFELEIALKAKSRYQDKIRKYVQHMRSANLKNKFFDRVQFVCSKESVARFLIKETRIYGELFQIILLTDFYTKRKEVEVG